MRSPLDLDWSESGTTHGVLLVKLVSDFCIEMETKACWFETAFFFLTSLFNLFLVALGLRCCSRAFSSCSKQGLLFVAVQGLLTGAASPVAEHRLYGACLVAVAPRLSCSSPLGIFPDQGSNPCPLHWQADFYPLCHQGNPDLYQSFSPAPTFSVHVAFSCRWANNTPLESQSWIDPAASILLKNPTSATLFSFLHHQSLGDIPQIIPTSIQICTFSHHKPFSWSYFP